MVDAYVGEIRLFGGNYAPQDWHLCDGSLLPISTYELLYAVIGGVYGGDGRTTFGLPNLKGRVPIGTGQGPGLQQNYALAANGGAETVTLAAANVPAHSHTLTASTAAANSATPSSALSLATVASNLRFYVDTSQGTVTGTQLLNAADVSATGGGLPHDNIMPCLALNYIICLNGLYPQPA